MDVVVVEDSDAGMTDDVIIEENGDMHVPDVVERQEYIFTEDYWTQGHRFWWIICPSSRLQRL